MIEEKIEAGIKERAKWKPTLNTTLKTFIHKIEIETPIPTGLYNMLLFRGRVGGRRLKTVKDLILSYRNGIQWSEKTRERINSILTKYELPQMLPKGKYSLD